MIDKDKLIGLRGEYSKMHHTTRLSIRLFDLYSCAIRCTRFNYRIGSPDRTAGFRKFPESPPPGIPANAVLHALHDNLNDSHQKRDDANAPRFIAHRMMQPFPSTKACWDKTKCVFESGSGTNGYILRNRPPTKQ